MTDTNRPPIPEQVEPLDYLLFRSDDNPRTRSTVLGVEILDSTPDWERFRSVFDNASRSIVRFRQRIVTPSVPITSPRWVVDPDFDIDFHVRRASVHRPATLREVLDIAEALLQSSMDSSRPLWSATLVEGLEDGRAAVLLHMSHAISDGVGAMELFEVLYDLSPKEKTRIVAPVPLPQDVSPLTLTLEGLRHLPSALVDSAPALLLRTGSAVTGAARMVATPKRAVSYLRSASRVVAPAGSPSPILAGRSLRTRTHVLTMPLKDLRAAAKAAGGTINDAYLAGLCGSLRHYHEAVGHPVDELSMAVPVSVRGEDADSGGNHFTAVNVAAPVGEADPSARIQNLKAQMRRGREEPALGVVGALAPALVALPKTLLDVLGGAIVSADVQATNIPGYQGETYLAGAKVLRHYGLGPLPGVALMAVLVSREGVCTVSARFDLAAFERADTLARCLVSGFAEVLALGGGDPPAID